MMLLDPTSLSARELSRLVISCVIPRPIALVTSVSEEGIVNAAPFSYFNAVSSAPPILMISVDRKNGERKDTSRNILHSKEFVVHIVNEQIGEKMNITSSNVPRNQSEVVLAGLTLTKSAKISTPRIVESPIHMECRLLHHVELGVSPTDVLFGEVVAFHIQDEIYVDGRADPALLKAVGRLGGMKYCKTRDIFEMMRPT
jgi:flavin reductase (DIM6/NTAB) family NADH-FMN oxidoreductase RutF